MLRSSSSDRPRLALVAEEIRAAPAEGALRFLWHLAMAAEERFELRVFHARGDLPDGLSGERVEFAKLRTSAPLAQRLRDFRPERILYAPSASVTINALWRARSLRSTTGGIGVGFLALQERPLTLAIRLAASFLRPRRLWVLSERMGSDWKRAGFDVRVVPGGVDLQRFRPASAEQRARLREEFGFDGSRPVVLHVGHIKPGRGLESLIRLAEGSRFQVVMVASPLTEVDRELRSRLYAAGVLVKREYIPAIEQVYQAADAYLFPVAHSSSSIEFPLSVLEAAACGLPVAATRFGSLPERFESQPGFRYLDEGESVERLLAGLLEEGAIDRSRLAEFGWPDICATILQDLERFGTEGS